MRVVIDTNILISAMLKDRSPEAAILCVVSRPDLEWVVCPEILQQYLEVIARPKFAFPKGLLNRWRDILTQATVSIETPQIAIDFPRDRKDARFLSCAMAAAADLLISGDADMDDARALICFRRRSRTSASTSAPRSGGSTGKSPTSTQPASTTPRRPSLLRGKQRNPS
jgi:uncharacterized protein